MVPFLLIGAGFVIATTVRTAIIFASLPKGLPASAAALNEASIGLGSRIGVVVAVVITTQVALDSSRQSLAGLPSGLADAQVGHFRGLLDLVSLHSIADLTAGLDASTLTAYQGSIVDGMQIAALIPGIVAIVTGILAFFAMGARDPVRSVWDHADERETAPTETPRATASPG